MVKDGTEASMSSALRRSSCPMLVISLILAANQLTISVACDQFQPPSRVPAHKWAESEASLASYEKIRQNQSHHHQMSAYPHGLAAEALVSRLSPTLESPELREDASGRYANKESIESPLRRARRFVGRSKKGRIMLAQRPTKNTTTTTSSTTTTTTNAPEDSEKPRAAAAESGESEAEESSDSGDYEELESSRKQPKTSSPVSESSESAEEGEVEEEKEEEVTTTTTQSTTTKATRTSGARKGTAARNRPTTRAPTSSSSSSSVEEIEEEEPKATTTRKRLKTKEPATTNSSSVSSERPHQHHRKKPLVALPFIRAKNTSICTPEAYLEFPRDLIGEKWRGRGLIIVHVLVVCYMFYALAVVCERYFMPSLEEFAQRLEISEDVAGATLMSAGSSAPELFTAILGVFVAKGDVGTGAIVGSAVFNILFVIGVCAFVSTTTAQLQWWPVLRDSVYYTFTVLVLILIIYDERITAFESATMIALYGVYICIMANNEQLKGLVTRNLMSHPVTAKLISSQSIAMDGPDDVFGGAGGQPLGQVSASLNANTTSRLITMHNKRAEDDSIWLAALLLVVRHKRLFRSNLRFQSAARYIITKRQHKQACLAEANRERGKKKHEEVNYFGPEGGADVPLNGTGSQAGQRERIEAYARSSTMSKNKFSIVSKEDYEFWHRPPEEGENYYLWLAKIPVNYVLHYTIPDCTLYPDKYALTFVISIIWTALFSYIMVWMVTIIGYTLGIPDSVMGVTFLAAGTSVPDCYSSIHAARNGMADMAVSNSIGSNVFDILIGLSVPWFIQSAIYPGVVATVNSRGVIYSVILLFLSLIVTIYLMNRYDWNLQPRLGLALIIAYALFIILTCMLEFNLFGLVNPPPCPAAPGSNY